MLLVAAVLGIALAAAGVASATDAYQKLPGGTSAQIADSVFYIAVDDGANGTGERLYYYFSSRRAQDQVRRRDP